MNRWLPQLASQHGAALDRTLDLVHLLMLVLFVGWGLFFAYVLVRFRRKRNPKADYAGITGHTTTWLEAGVAVAEAVLLIGFSIPLWADRVDRFPPPQQSTRVRVVGEQFAWNVHYPGADGVFGRSEAKLVDVQSNPLGLDRNDPAAKDDVVTLNHLYLPKGRPASPA
jgi:cytochrome c oxidase subunit 2